MKHHQHSLGWRACNPQSQPSRRAEIIAVVVANLAVAAITITLAIMLSR